MYDDKKKLTRENGAPVANHTNVVTVGPRGPMVLQDVWFLEKMAHFDREVIPERRMHAKGSGAFGKFTATCDMAKYTKAKLFSKVDKETPVFVRFSTVAGERGAADAERDIRGFAIKFYTEEGNWDLVGNNTPVFFIRDPIHFPDLNHAVKRDPKTNLRSAQNNWDFWTMLPEALHQVTIVMSDRGIPVGYRHMHGFGSHTYSLFNAKNERVWVKFHLRTQQGIKNLSDKDAQALIAKDRESSQHDLFYAIERGEYPRWTMYFQIMTQEQAKKHRDNPFDITKVWSHKEYPLLEVGMLELNCNPENYFAEVEQAAFNPANLIPGIGHSPDKLLQGRLFSYGDAQRYRLGVNHSSIPVNAPKCLVHSYHRDGFMRVDGNYGATIGYHPNSYGQWVEQREYAEPSLAVEGAIDNYDPYVDDDCFYQPGDLYRLMSEDKRALLIKNTATNIVSVTENIKYRHAAHCYLADKEYGCRIADALALMLDRVISLSKMSRKERLCATSEAVWK
ncbi:MAG: catalase [Nitrososphaerota archaeon]|jgi:catalase|nr:catalase [Nitrososphaerota archaeon]